MKSAYPAPKLVRLSEESTCSLPETEDLVNSTCSILKSTCSVSEAVAGTTLWGVHV